MAVPGTVQALIAAFSFGILFNAASGALVIYVKGHGSAIYRDGLRLVLILFLSTASLWALVEFLSTLIDPSATSTCQVAVVFSSLFDQFGRVFAEQYLVWAVPKGNTKTGFSLVPQILVFGRLFVGVAFTAVTRTQFKPTCAPISSIRAVSITTIALDAVIIGFLSVQAFSSSLSTESPSSRSTTIETRTVRLVVVGVFVWLGTSVTSLLGLDSIDLFYRTALPGIGLTILVGLVTILSQTLVVPREPPRRPDSPISREPRDLSSSDSAEYPPSRYEDLKTANTVAISAFAAKTEANRSIRRNDDGTFPPISKPVAVRSDMNGNPIQGQLFSATTPSNFAPALSAVPPLPENWGIIKSNSGRMKAVPKSKARTGKLAISNPILTEDENAQNPLKRIPTIDLAKAANNDRLRREKYAERIPSLVAQRPAPRPPSPPTAPDTIDTELQVTGDVGRSESIKSSNTSSGLSVQGNASSTATQLSPGADVVRRRSPRHPGSAPLAAPFKVIRPGEPIRIPIPRPIERKQDVPPTKPEPVKTPLQRRPTTGLPSNPRAQTLKSLTNEASNQKTQTVMFVNNIVYNNPDSIGDIIQEAGKVPQPPDSGDSVVNRPRPIPRKSDKDRQVFPSEISPNHHHRRSKSAGSIVSRKSILQSVPGSPTGLPSLPPMPPTTGGVSSSVKGMTVEEKMNLLYSAPLSAPSGTKRRSSVPDLPPIPVAFQESWKSPKDSMSDSESNNDMRASKGSKRTTARTSSLLGITVVSRSGNQSNESAIAFDDHNPVDEVGNSWLPGLAFNAQGESFKASGELKRRSSPVLPPSRQLSMSTTRSESRFGDEETTTNWGSVYSPVAPVSRQNARSTYIRKGSHNVPGSEEVPIIMFDESLEEPVNNHPSTDSKRGNSPISGSDSSRNLSWQFHHRIGDDCPTFSARKDKLRARKMPPPTPLLLNGKVNKGAVVKLSAVPSPIETPRAAYEVIQAQLKKFEQLDRELAESPAQRIALLANLEQEMGQLESEWQSNHEHLGRDSMSSIRTSTQQSRRTSMVPPLSRPSSQRSSVASVIAERRALRRARLQSGGGEEIFAPSSQNTLQSFENAQGAFWRTESAEANVQDIENEPELLAQPEDLNFMPVPEADPGNASSYETNEPHSYSESEATPRVSSLDDKQSLAPVYALWSQTIPDRQSVKSWLWEPGTKLPRKQNQSYDLLGSSIRSTTRRQFDELKIESSSLWQNESKLMPIGLHEGLWDDHPSHRLDSAKALRRPVTMRPPRKNRRVTLLPDIIENPEPLPNKRGTLGIFQFPWGEKSDHATLQYRPSQGFMPMPGTMATGRSIVNPVIDSQLERFEDTEYSSSFFDEYDEEGDNFSDFSGSGDDDFDETTLWEIASLLQTDQVPSKNSLLFTPLQFPSSGDASVLTDYVADMPSDDEYGNGVSTTILTPSGITAVVDNHIVSHDIRRPSLWNPKRASQNDMQKFGLPQHETADWNEHFGEIVRRTRSKALVKDLERIQSSSLWSPIVKATGASKVSFLWEAPKSTREPQEMSLSAEPAQIQPQIPRLWLRSGAATSPSHLGLPEPEAQFWHELVSQGSVVSRSKSRVDYSPPRISSSTLWSLSKTTNLATLWTQPAIFPMPEDNNLFSPGSLRREYRTTSRPPAALSLAKRVFRCNNTALESLTSTALWSTKDSTSVKPSTTGLWKPNSDIPQMASPLPTKTVAATQSYIAGLWKPPMEVKTQEPLGLFDLKKNKRDFRRTSNPPAALLASSTPRVTRENALVITSQNLWAPQPVLKKEEICLLWQRRVPASSRVPTLFRLDAPRTNYRTTSADPAALVVARRPRTMQQPLEHLQSNQLWVNDQATHTELDWITIGTLQSTSLFPSSSSSASSSPLLSSTDRVLEKESTSTVSAPSKSKGAFFSNWFSKKKDKSSPVADIPEVQPTVATPDISVLPQDFIIRDLDNIPDEKSAHTALRHRYRRTIVYNADWKSALADAVTASYPKTPSSERNTGIQEDIVNGENSGLLDFDVTRRHPVFFGSLETAAEIVHPAFTGYLVRMPIESSERPTDSSNIPYLWARSIDSQVTLSNGLWTASSQMNPSFGLPLHQAQKDDYAIYQSTRRNNTTDQLVSDVTISFGKQGLWKRSDESSRPRHPSSLRKNWLEDSVNKRFTRIELRY